MNKSKALQLVFFICLLVLFALSRSPNLFIDPRLWAEEGTIYLSRTQSSSIMAALFMPAYPKMPYFNLSSSLSITVAAIILPLEYIPDVTTLVSLLIYLMPFVLIFLSDSLLWPDIRYKLGLCLVLLFLPWQPGEIWLNTLNAQIYCGITSIVLLCTLDRKRQKFSYSNFVLLLFNCLNGPYTAFLFPVFLLKTIKRPSPYHLSQCLAVLIGTVMQFSAVIYGKYFQLLPFDRFKLNISEVVLQIGTLNIPLIHPAPILVSLGVLGIIFFIYNLRFRDLSDQALFFQILLCSLSLQFIFIPIFSIRGTIGGRYAVVPIALIMLILWTVTFIHEVPKLPSALTKYALLLSVFIGIYQFLRNDVYLHCSERCSAWSTEVAKWREDSSHKLEVWPGVTVRSPSGWKVTLKRDAPYR